MEVFRHANGKAPLHPCDGCIVAIASDQPFPEADIPVVDLNNIPAVADMVQRRSVSLEATLAALQDSHSDA
jgi:molybdopterin-guanine dinucleotide biosynthesis adapter protein